MKNVDYSIIIDKHILLHTRKKDGPDIRYAAGYSNRHPFSDRITDSLSALAYQHGWISGQSTFGRYIRYVLGLRRLNAFHSSNFIIIPEKLFFIYLFLPIFYFSIRRIFHPLVICIIFSLGIGIYLNQPRISIFIRHFQSRDKLLHCEFLDY